MVVRSTCQTWLGYLAVTILGAASVPSSADSAERSSGGVPRGFSLSILPMVVAAR